MKIVPGKTLVLSLVFLALGTLVGYFVPLLYSIFAFLFLLLLIAAFFDFLRLRKLPPSLKIEREVPEKVGRGSDGEIIVTITRESSSPEIFGKFRDIVPDAAKPNYSTHEFHLNGSQAEVIRYKLNFPERGHYAIGGTFLRVRTSLSLMEIQWKVSQNNEVRVLPESLVVDDELKSNHLAEIMYLDKKRHSKLRGNGLEFESLKEYRQGDDISRIDWKTSARQRRHIIRQYQVEHHRDAMILIDCGRLMATDTGEGTKLDRAVDSALMLARVILGKGDRCGIALFSDQVKGFVPPLSGEATFQSIVENVYDLQPDGKETNFGEMFAHLQAKVRKRCLLIVLSDMSDIETSVQYRASLQRLSKRHIVLFAALQHPLLEKKLLSNVETMEDLGNAAFAGRLVRQRKDSIDILRSGGIYTIDVDPRKLTIPLINQFVAIRESNVL